MADVGYRGRPCTIRREPPDPTLEMQHRGWFAPNRFIGITQEMVP